jgi:hypothetical protein
VRRVDGDDAAVDRVNLHWCRRRSRGFASVRERPDGECMRRHLAGEVLDDEVDRLRDVFRRDVEPSRCDDLPHSARKVSYAGGTTKAKHVLMANRAQDTTSVKQVDSCVDTDSRERLVRRIARRRMRKEPLEVDTGALRPPLGGVVLCGHGSHLPVLLF